MSGAAADAPVLLHVCCAPCSIACVDSLREEGFAPTAFWFNPNIHPFTEYRARRDTLRAYAASIGLPLVEQDTYGLRPFLAAVGGAVDARCPVCYAMRLDAAAAYAAQNGFPRFTTTLLISPYQQHALLIEAGERAAAAHGIDFFVPRLPAAVPPGAAARAGARPVHAEVLRLHLQRGGTLLP